MRSGLVSFVCSRPTYSFHRVLRVVMGLALLCASAMVVEPRAHAQSDKSGEVLLLFRQGQFAARMMDWPRAYKLFRRCYELQPSYDIAANLGQVSVKAGKPAEGALYLWRSLRAFPLSEKAERHQAVELMFQVARKNVTTVTVTTEPADAQLLVDGADQQRSPGEPIFLDPGQHILTAEAPGYEPNSQPVDAIAGTDVSLTFTLEKSPGTPAPPDTAAGAPPKPAPEAEPAAEPQMPAPRPAAKPAPTTRAVSTGPGPVRHTGETASGGQRSVWVPLLVGGGVAAIGVTLGIVYTVSAQSTMTDAHDLDHEIGSNSSCVSGREADPDRCDRLRSLAEKVDSQRNTSFIAFGIAGAAAAATLGYLFWPTGDRPSAQVRPGFNVGAQHTLVSLSGRF